MYSRTEHNLKFFRFSNPNPAHPEGRYWASLSGYACSFNPYLKFYFLKIENKESNISCISLYEVGNLCIKFNV